MSKRKSLLEIETAEALALVKTSTSTDKNGETAPKAKKAPRKLTRAAKMEGAVPAPKKKKVTASTTPEPEPVAPEPEKQPEPVAPEPEKQPEPATRIIQVAPPVTPRSCIEEPGISEASRNSVSFGRRFHQRFLVNMYGAFLTLLDEQGRILMFVGGALRCRTSEEADSVFEVRTVDVLMGMTGAGSADQKPYFPEVNLTTLKGDDRRGGKEVSFKEIPYLTKRLGERVPEARRWGVLTIGPSPTKRMVGALPNGQNEEVFLNGNTWKTDDRAGRVPGSSTPNLVERLAPRALELAQSMPSAWLLALTGASLYGGVNVLPPTAACRVPASPALSELCRTEMGHRARTAARLAAKREARIGGWLEGDDDAGVSNIGLVLAAAEAAKADTK